MHLMRTRFTPPVGIRLSTADEAQAARWTREHATRSEEQGWCMSDYDASGALQLQKCDDNDAFASDDEAILFVRQRALFGDETAILALELDRHFEPVIYGPDWESKIHGG